MTDDLVKRLRDSAFLAFDDGTNDYGTPFEAADRIDALTEQLEAARRDAKEAEAYAEELEKDLNICRMAQVVMENGVAEAEANLAKAVDTLMFYGGVMPNAFLPIQDGGEKARTTIAELKGTTNDQG